MGKTEWYIMVSFLAMIVCYILFLVIYIVSTINGLSWSTYGVFISTNSFGEDYVELALCFAFLPGVRVLVHRAVKRFLREEPLLPAAA
jgi:hypothetical protein